MGPLPVDDHALDSFSVLLELTVSEFIIVAFIFDTAKLATGQHIPIDGLVKSGTSLDSAGVPVIPELCCPCPTATTAVASLDAMTLNRITKFGLEEIRETCRASDLEAFRVNHFCYLIERQLQGDLLIAE